MPAETKEKVDSKPKPSQKQLGKDASEEPREDYVHVRARRGQATNSHSLAERVRFLSQGSIFQYKEIYLRSLD